MASSVMFRGFPPGTEFGAYRILRCIGVGGMGSVFEAEHVLMQRRVALKVLHAESKGSFDARRYFLREGALLVKVRHANVVRVYDAGFVDDRPFLAMELLEGSPFDRFLAERGPLEPTFAVDLVARVASGLAAVHDEGVVHRDVKPENLFLVADRTGRPEPRLIDFGIAKEVGRVPDSKSAVGTPRYMAPEQLLASRPLDGRSDLFALSVVLYEALTGVSPFASTNLHELVQQRVADAPRPPSEHRAGIPGTLDAVVLAGLRYDPDARPPNARVFETMLRRSLASIGASNPGRSPLGAAGSPR